MTNTSTKTDVHIQVTKEQYYNLLNLIHLGNWMVNALSDTIDEEQIAKYEALEQMLFSYARPFLQDSRFFSMNPFIVFSAKCEKVLQEMIMEYDNEVFWESLALSLAKRDVMNSVGPVVRMNDDHVASILKKESVYLDEFEKHGVSRLVIHHKA
ncbi:hypothetical protein [Metabacillus iocasae]|uniref:Uncharacterized protein n=1 Tax=Priestia iocasae TaxID=2291674 RepID=A0ABS2QVU9_9BACI|nr:hypothetical protein [Metabacillus iocasae]MBM7703614.1 hypothetical protein [Metabacillus iocasae]